MGFFFKLLKMQTLINEKYIKKRRENMENPSKILEKCKRIFSKCIETYKSKGTILKKHTKI
jgi:hypothetical protein